MNTITMSPAAAVSDGVAARARGPRPAIRHYPELDDESSTTAELLQAHLPESRVVKAFNNIYFPHLTDLARPPGTRSALSSPLPETMQPRKQR